MPRLQYKSFSTPDDVRAMPKGIGEIVSLGDTTIARARWEPGWRWVTDLGPIAGTPSCQLHHLGYSISGVLQVVMDDGQTLEIPPGSAYEIPAGHDARVIGDAAWETVEWTSGRMVGVSPDAPGDRIVATVLFTDIVDSTGTLERVGDASWREQLAKHNVRLRDELNTFRGREVATTGDGFLAIFDSATRAVRCAAAMTKSAREVGLPIRVGVHTGEVEFVGGDARGVAVHTAARVMSLAGVDEVLVSSTTRDLVEGSGLVLEDAGSHVLKGLSGPRTLFRLAVAP
jgi:class 3 adenylate cyclase